MKSGVILGIILFGLAIVMTKTPVNALYYFNVKTTNKTGKQIEVGSVEYRPKGNSVSNTKARLK